MKAVDFILDLRPCDIPENVLAMARRCIVDTLGVWASSIDGAASDAARRFVAKSHPGPLALPFSGEAVSQAGYAFAGAASIDSIDAHDGYEGCKGHASVTLLPVLLAEQFGQSYETWDDLLCDFIVGQEIAIRAGLTLHETASDFHASGAWNALGGVAIGARRRDMDPETMRQALGICEYFGPRAEMMRCIAHPSMLKDASSWGALTAISALDLADAGYLGAPAILIEGEEQKQIWSDLGDCWRILGSNFKYYPVCRWAHPAIEAVLSLKERHGLACGDIESIVIYTFKEAVALHTRQPENSDAAQYSLPVSAAIALKEGHILPLHVRPDYFQSEDIAGLVQKIQLVEVPDYSQVFPGKRYAHAMITLKSGMALNSERYDGRGTPEHPMDDQTLWEKFEAYANPSMTDQQIALSKPVLENRIMASPIDEWIAALHMR